MLGLRRKGHWHGDPECKDVKSGKVPKFDKEKREKTGKDKRERPNKDKKEGRSHKDKKKPKHAKFVGMVDKSGQKKSDKLKETVDEDAWIAWHLQLDELKDTDARGSEANA